MSGKDAATSAPDAAAEDAEFCAGVVEIKAKNFATAAEILGGVLERFVDKYGELAPECADVYVQYGLALLREVEEREENADVLGDMMPKEIATGVAEKSEAAGESSKDNAQGDEQGGDGSGEGEGDGEEGEEEEEGGADGEEQPETDKDGGSADASGKAPAEGGAGEAGGEEEADDLQIAYEVLESARIIMEKEDDQSEKLGDVFGYLGDVNLRNEQFDQALADYSSCLKIREATCLNDDRLLIEVYHQMAMVYLLVGGQKDNAVSVLRKAIEHCEYRLGNLRMMIEGEGEVVKAPKGSSLKAMTKAEADAEMIEVEQIAEEFRERIEAEELKPDAGPEGAGSSSGAGGSSSAGAAASSLGLDAVKLLAAQSGLMGAPSADGSKGFVNEGFAGVPESAAVKTIKVVSKKKMAQAQAATSKSEGKRAADDDAEQGGDAKKAKVSSDETSAAPTPARPVEA